MKNFKGITNFINKTYDSALELVSLTLANALNKNLRTIIIRQGKDPDYVKPAIGDIVREAFEMHNWGLPADQTRPKSYTRPSFNFVNRKRDFPTVSKTSIERLIEKVEKYNAEQASAPIVVEEPKVSQLEITLVKPIELVTTTPQDISDPQVLVHTGFDIGNSVPSVKPKKRSPRKRATKKAVK